MPLQIKIEGKFAKPIIVCDHCGQQITDARSGNYEWIVNERGHPVEDRIYYTHKQCCRAFEQSNGDRSNWNAVSLQCLPVYLANNLKVKLKEAIEITAAMAGFSL